jgi:hypothetical protein
MPFTANAAGRHHIPRQRQRMTNWSEYDAALRHRGSLTVWVTDEAIAAWQAERRTTRGGQRRYSSLAITTALTLRTLFRLGLRQTEGLIGSVIDLLGLHLAIPDHSTLRRRAATLPVVRLSVGAKPVHLLIDSTGLKLCGAGEWLVEKRGSARCRSWRKLYIGMDADTGQILAALLTPKEVDDASQIGTSLDQVDGSHRCPIGDGAYDQDTVYADVAARHRDAAVVVPPRATAVLSTDAKATHCRHDAELHADPWTPPLCSGFMRPIGVSGGILPPAIHATR